EGIRAVVVGYRGIGEAAVGVQREGAVARAGDEHGSQSITVDVRVVGQHAGSGDGQRGVLVGGKAVIDRRRRIVHRADGEAHRGGGGVGAAVAGLVGERIRAIV